MSHLEHFVAQLEQFKQQGQYRQFKQQVSSAFELDIAGQRCINLASNDYLGLASRIDLREEFFDTTQIFERQMSASSSRLLTGNFPVYDALEVELSSAFGRSALLFNSGYHMNIGILPALCDRHSLIIADKLIHASMIDGIRLSKANYVRYRHNDLAHLEQLLQHYKDDENVQRIFVVTESIFSMDGDETDLTALVQLKKNYSKVMLYVDEAHAVGVRGAKGLGCAEQYNVLNEIDLLVGTFGKALASVGGYLICHKTIRDYLINTMRPLIFSTAQPPINIAWTQFIFQKMQSMQNERAYLADLATQCQQGVQALGFDCPSTSQIVPVILGDSARTMAASAQLQQAGFYVLGVRPPTVPKQTSRLRICLNQQLNQNQLYDVLQHLGRLS